MTLTNTDLLNIYETMLTIRASEARMVALFKEREFGGHVLPCLGQEAIPAAFSKVLAPTDYVVTGRRGAGTTSLAVATWMGYGPNCTAGPPA